MTCGMKGSILYLLPRTPFSRTARTVLAGLLCALLTCPGAGAQVPNLAPGSRVAEAELLGSALFDIFSCESDLRLHCSVEDNLFVPAVAILEEQVAAETAALPANGEAEEAKANGVLSEREREIVHWVVCGLPNKEIAARLFISLNTVLTHRKNIARKLGIHSVAGLTIYAIVNKVVDVKDIEQGGGEARRSGAGNGK